MANAQLTGETVITTSVIEQIVEAFKADTMMNGGRESTEKLATQFKQDFFDVAGRGVVRGANKKVARVVRSGLTIGDFLDYMIDAARGETADYWLPASVAFDQWVSEGGIEHMLAPTANTEVVIAREPRLDGDRFKGYSPPSYVYGAAHLETAAQDGIKKTGGWHDVTVDIAVRRLDNMMAEDPVGAEMKKWLATTVRETKAAQGLTTTQAQFLRYHLMTRVLGLSLAAPRERNDAYTEGRYQVAAIAYTGPR